MPSTPLACTLYRALHRSLRQINLSSGTGVLTLRLPVRTEAWGNSSTSYGSDKHDEAIKRYLGDLAQCAEPAFLKQEPSQARAGISRCAIGEQHLKELLREMFQIPAGGDAEQHAAALSKGFRALRVLGEQAHLAACSSTTEDLGVRVELTSSFVKRKRSGAGLRLDSEPGLMYSFAYRARIHNVGQQCVQLLGRCWRISNEDGKISMHIQRGTREAQAVVGKTPILRPGEVFEYVSRAGTETPVGRIQGSFQMVYIDGNGKAGDFFDAEVAPAKLLAHERALEAEQSSEEEDGGPHIVVGVNVPWDDDLD